MRTGVLRAAGGGAVLLVLVAATVAARLPRVRATIERLVEQAGLLSAHHWLAFCGAQIAVAAFGVLPASLIAVAAGATYGLAKGLLMSAVSTMLGGWLAFLLSRSMLRPFIGRLIRRYDLSARFDEAVAVEGWRFVCLLRISPVMPFAATSYGLGLTRIGQRAYLLGTLASLPALASYVALGALGRAGFGPDHLQRTPVQWLLLILGVAAIFLAVARVKRLIDTNRSSASAGERGDDTTDRFGSESPGDLAPSTAA